MSHRPRRIILSAAAVLGAVAVGPVSAAQAADFTCEASALRGTVLGQAIEPVVYGRTGPCKTGQQVPSVALPELLDASVLVAAGTNVQDPIKPAASSVGGLAGARVKLLPSLPIVLPTEAVIASIPPITVPVGPGVPLLGIPANVTIDIKEAVRALAPGGRLPQADLISANVLTSIAAAACDGADVPTLAGVSSVAGVKLLGQDVNVDGALQQNINVVDSANIDPSNLDITKIVVSAPGTNLQSPPVLAAVQAAIRPVLDGLPNIMIPAAVAQVKLTANEQTRAEGSLTQRALRVQASLVGTALVDLVIGEAKVTAAGACPKVMASGGEPEPPAGPAELQCTDRKLVLLDVFKQNGRVRLTGAADKDLVGKLVDLRFRASGNRVVARARVKANGSFTTTARMPSAALRDTNDARYTATRGGERSLPLKLIRRLRTSSVRSSGGFVTIRGQVSRPLALPVQEIRLVRRVACGKAQLIKRFKPRSDGTFSVRVKASSRPAVYRATTRVRKVTTNPKTYPTFTLPRGIDLNQR